MDDHDDPATTQNPALPDSSPAASQNWLALLGTQYDRCWQILQHHPELSAALPDDEAVPFRLTPKAETTLIAVSLGIAL